MKKVFSIFIAFLMGFSISNASSMNFSNQDFCDDYAMSGVIAEIFEYGDMSDEDASVAYDFYYTSCKSSGGTKLLDPILL